MINRFLAFLLSFLVAVPPALSAPAAAWVNPVARSVPYDFSASNYAGADVQTVLEEIRTQNVWTSSTTATTAAGTQTLTVTSNSLQFYTGTAAGYTINLPSATTLFRGRKFELDNTSNQTIALKDGAGGALMTLGQTSVGYCTVQDNSTTAGTWVCWQVFVSSLASGILNYNLTSTTSFATSSATDVAITGFTLTPNAGTYAVWFSANGVNTGAGADNTCTIYNGASAVTDSQRTVVGTTGTHNFIMSTQTISLFNGTNAATVFCRTGGTLTITGRSLLLIRLGS